MFEQREEAYEAKWAHDEEMLFRVTGRRNLLLGQWAAEKLGLSGAAADAYAQSVVAAGLSKATGAAMKKVSADFRTANIVLSEFVLIEKMKDLLAQAWSEITLEV